MYVNLRGKLASPRAKKEQTAAKKKEGKGDSKAKPKEKKSPKKPVEKKKTKKSVIHILFHSEILTRYKLCACIFCSQPTSNIICVFH